MNAFGLPVSGGDGQFKSFVKYVANAGRFMKRERFKNAAGMYESEDIDITGEFLAVIDFANLQRGWLHFPRNSAPRKVLGKMDEPFPARPADLGDDGKPAFRSGIAFDLILNGEKEVREMSFNAQSAIDGFSAVYTAYLDAPESKAGKLPVVKLAKVNPTKNSSGATNYTPVLEIVSWIDRPALFDAPQAEAPAPTPVAAPVAASGSTAFGFGD